MDRKIGRTCEQCGANFQAYPCDVKRGKMRFCSHSCSSMSIRKHKVQEFEGIRFYKTVEGYYNNPDFSVKMHHAVWRHHNGAIPEGHVIHHKNGDKADNRIENLECLTRGAHSTEHNKNRGPDHARKMANARWSKCRGE